MMDQILDRYDGVIYIANNIIVLAKDDIEHDQILCIADDCGFCNDSKLVRNCIHQAHSQLTSWGNTISKHMPHLKHAPSVYM